MTNRSAELDRHSIPVREWINERAWILFKGITYLLGMVCLYLPLTELALAQSVDVQQLASQLRSRICQTSTPVDRTKCPLKDNPLFPGRYDFVDPECRKKAEADNKIIDEYNNACGKNASSNNSQALKSQPASPPRVEAAPSTPSSARGEKQTCRTDTLTCLQDCITDKSNEPAECITLCRNNGPNGFCFKTLNAPPPASVPAKPDLSKLMKEQSVRSQSSDEIRRNQRDDIRKTQSEDIARIEQKKERERERQQLAREEQERLDEERRERERIRRQRWRDMQDAELDQEMQPFVPQPFQPRLAPPPPQQQYEYNQQYNAPAQRTNPTTTYQSQQRNQSSDTPVRSPPPQTNTFTRTPTQPSCGGKTCAVR
jgi:hypothetical protein